MQNEEITVRGYSPQNTGRMNTLPYQPGKPVNQPTIWQLLDPAAVALLIAAILGLAYGIYATVAFWWLKKVTMHLIVAWLGVVLNAIALFRSNRQLMALSAIAYIAASLLFVNYFYLLLPQALLCIWAWWKTREA